MKGFLQVFAGILAVFSTSCQPARTPVDYVNPYMGNISTLLVPTYPTVYLPNSMLRVYPKRADYTGTRLSGLPVITTMHRESSAFDILVSNSPGEIRIPGMTYSYDNETVTPYSYSVDLDEAGISVHYALSHQSGIYSFDFESTSEPTIALCSKNGEMTYENGGISDLSMVLDTIVDLRTVPVRLNDASSKYKKNTIFLTHSYGIPIRFKKNDTTAVGEGTMAYIGHTGEFSTYTRSYDDNIAMTDTVAREFYNNKFFINPTATSDSVRVMNLENRLFIKLQPWAREAIVSGLEGGVGYQHLSYYKFSPEMLMSGNRNVKENNLYLYFGARGSVKQYFQWEGFGKYYLAGYNRNDFSIGGKIKVSFYPISQGIHITGKIDVSQQRPAFFYNNYYSNHYVWENDFDKTTNTSVQGKMTIPTYGMEAFFGYSLLNNNIYLDTLGNAVQNTESMSVMTAWLRKDFRLWKFHMENKILFQLSSKQEVVPLPKLALNLRYYLEFNLVKNVLSAQIGADATFNTDYYGQAYSPASGLFYNQRDEKIGGTPYIDVFVNLQWKRASIFVKWVNAGQDWPDSDYFSANRYVRPQTALKFGIFWPFYLR